MVSDTQERHEEENVQEALGKLCTLPVFILFGAALPWSAWFALGWPLVALGIAVVLLRRLPVIAVLFPLLRGSLGGRDALFLGWFGPIGVAAIFYGIYAARHAEMESVWHVVSALIFGSVLVHGLTAAPLTRLYGRIPMGSGLVYRGRR